MWQHSELFRELRAPQTGGACSKCDHFDSCRGGCMAAKFFTGLPLDGPDPECVQGYGESALAADGEMPEAERRPLPHRASVAPRRRRSRCTLMARPPAKVCDENPLAGMN